MSGTAHPLWIDLNTALKGGVRTGMKFVFRELAIAAKNTWFAYFLKILPAFYSIDRLYMPGYIAERSEKTSRRNQPLSPDKG